MATITSAQSGPVNDTATWVGGTIPGPYDIALIANLHVVHNPPGHTWELGDEAAPTTVCLRGVGTGGTGVFHNYGTLKLRADAKSCNAAWTFHGGGIVESANASSMVSYYVGDADGQANAQLIIAGTGPGSGRVITRNGSGMGGFRIRPATTSGPTGKVTGSWWHILNMGTTTIPGLQVGFGSVNSLVDVEQVIYESSGAPANYINVRLDTKWSMRNVTFKSTINSSNRTTDISGAVGTRTQPIEFIDCVFDKIFRFTGPNFRAIRCLMLGNCEINGAGYWEHCIMLNQTGGPWNVNIATMVRIMRVKVSPGVGNWHGIQWSGASPGSIDGCIFDGSVADAVGDLLFPASVGWTGQNIMTTKSETVSGSYGKLVGIGVSGVTGVVVEHCTHHSNSYGEGGIAGVGETYAGVADMFVEVKHCAAVGTLANHGVIALRHGTGAAANVKDAIAPAGLVDNIATNSYNGGINGMANQTAGGGDGQMFTTPPPPAPLDINMLFVDDTRNLATWYRKNVGGAPDTRANDTLNALNALATMNDDSPTIPGANATTPYSWISAGLRPRNPRARTMVSAKNGGWVGAMEGRNVSRKRVKSLI